MLRSNRTARQLARAQDRFVGRVAAITGCGSGIGQALSIELADRGCHLALSDIDYERLNETVGLVEGRGVKVASRVVDVADRDAVYRWADRSASELDQVNFIFNNAGVGSVATIEALGIDDFHWLMNINFWGVVNGTQAFLPHMKRAGDGHVVNISSVFGLQAIPSQAAYNASKFAIRGFTDALRMELDLAAGGVSASIVHPGGVKTRIALDARLPENLAASSDRMARDFDRIAMTSPHAAAAKILSGVAANRRRILVGPDAYAFDVASRLPAVVPQRAITGVSRLIGRRA